MDKSWTRDRDVQVIRHDLNGWLGLTIFGIKKVCGQDM